MLQVYIILNLLHLSTALSIPKNDAQQIVSSTTTHIYTDGHRPNMFVRFQKPPPSQATISARVTRLDWKSTLVSVTSALNNFSMTNEDIDMLWMDYTSRSLKFAGFLDPEHTGIVTQAGLSEDDTAVTLILPSAILPSVEATSKITKIKPQLSQLGSTIAKNCAVSTGLFGISGRLAVTDYAYATGKDVREAMLELGTRKTAFLEARISGQIPSDKDTHDLRLNAVGSDGRNIVIHLNMW